MKPEGGCWDRIMVQQKTSEEQAEKHDQTANQIGNATITENNTNEKADVGSGQVEQNKNQHEPRKLRPSNNETSHGIDDHTHDDRWDKSKRHNVE